MTKPDKKKGLAVLLSAVVFWLLDFLHEAYRFAGGRNFLDKVATLATSPPKVWPFSVFPTDMLFALIGVAVIWALLQLHRMNQKNYRRRGVEYGSAKWGKPKDIAPFIDPVFQNNILLTQTERMRLGLAPEKKWNRNLNVLVVGGSGSGKTRFYVEPNLMQCHSSYVVTDSKGSIIRDVGRLLERQGYSIRIFNLIDLSQSMHFNPFAYIHSEEDILTLVNTLIANTTKSNKTGGDQFWEDAERLLYCALIGYLWYEAPPAEQNFATLIDLLDAMNVREEDESYQNAIDLMFEELALKKPNHFAVRQYKKYKMAAGKTAKSILITCGARLAPFDIQAVRDLTSYDEMRLDTLGDQKTALFVLVSDTDPTFNFLAAMLYTQLFNRLCKKADEKYQGHLPVPVRCLLDEFANIGRIPHFDRLISTIRSRNISACIMLQSISQLKQKYKDSMNTILDNCDSYLFLGGQGKETLKDLSEQLGQETIDYQNDSDTRGSQRSYGVSTQKAGRALLNMDEIARLDSDQCILRIRGVRPFRSEKFDIMQHPAYPYLAESGQNNAFSIDRYLRQLTHLRLPPDAIVPVFDVGTIS